MVQSVLHSPYIPSSLYLLSLAMRKIDGEFDVEHGKPCLGIEPRLTAAPWSLLLTCFFGITILMFCFWSSLKFDLMISRGSVVIPGLCSSMCFGGYWRCSFISCCCECLQLLMVFGLFVCLFLELVVLINFFVVSLFCYFLKSLIRQQQ